MLELQGIRKTFYPGTPNEKKALNGVDLHLNAGDFVTIVGSNGAGNNQTGFQEYYKYEGIQAGI